MLQKRLPFVVLRECTMLVCRACQFSRHREHVRASGFIGFVQQPFTFIRRYNYRLTIHSYPQPRASGGTT